MSLVEGQVVGGRYRVHREIAEGGMGSVFEVERLEDGARLALKVLLPELGAGTASVERFRREGQLLSKIDHKGVVKILDAGLMKDGAAFLVLELIEGETLLDFFRREAPVTAGSFVEVVSGIAEALDAVHAHGVVHRDLKPANIFVGEDGVKLVDFGIARATELTRLTLTGQLVGTLRYMSPEQMLGRDHDHRADIYALGVITWAALAGRPPFLASGMAIVKEALAGTPRLDEAVPDLGTDLYAAVHRAMAMDPDARYPTAGAFAEAFRAAAIGAPRKTSVSKRGFRPLSVPPPVTAAEGRDDDPTVAPPARARRPAAAPVVARAEEVVRADATTSATSSGASRRLPFAAAALAVVGAALLATAYVVASSTPDESAERTEARAPGTSGPDQPSASADDARSTQIITIPAGAQVDFDGTIIGNTPLDVPHEAADSMELIISLAGYESVPVRLTDLTQSRVTVELEAASRGRRRPPTGQPNAPSPPELADDEPETPDDEPAAAPERTLHSPEVCDPWSGENCD